MPMFYYFNHLKLFLSPSFPLMVQGRGRDRVSTLSCSSSSWTSSTYSAKMSKTLTSLHRVKQTKQQTEHFFFEAQTLPIPPIALKKIEKPQHQTHGFCPLIYFLFIAQTVRVTGLRGRWARWWRIWCSSLRRCCKNFTAEHSGETMKTCSTFWQIRSGRWEKRPIEICFCHERAVKTSKLQSFIDQMKIMFSLFFFFIGDALSECTVCVLTDTLLLSRLLRKAWATKRRPCRPSTRAPTKSCSISCLNREIPRKRRRPSSGRYGPS